MKLWDKKSGTVTSALSKKIELFTIGNDKHWDLYIAKFDVQASLAHANMLHEAGMLSRNELQSIKNGLDGILDSINSGKFVIEEGVEDVHSQIEYLLTKEIGEAGKKIHTGRSRNDQSLVAIKLYIRQALIDIASEIQVCFNRLQLLSERHKLVLLPGYTHLQIAMPSSFGLWFGAYAESFTDDMELLLAAYRVANKNPLGSAAGYGSSLPLNRSKTTSELSFDEMNYNVVYAQMTRGKTEKITAMALASVAATLNRFCSDVCLFVSQNFGFISFPDEITTGSSIMPHKKNPDVFELIRARTNRIQALPNELTLLTSNLTSGYFRDYQLTKECLFPAIEELKNCIQMLTLVLEHIRINTAILCDDKYKYLFSVEAVNELVKQGITFREAYQVIARQIEDGSYEPVNNTEHTHEGSLGNLMNQAIAARFNNLFDKLK